MAPTKRKDRLAILDDDADLRRLLHLLLQDEYELATSRDGTELHALVV